MSFEIESGVPVPMRHETYPFALLKDGESFFVETSRENGAGKKREMEGMIRLWQSEHGGHFTVRVVVGGVRVWRVSESAAVKDRRIIPAPPQDSPLEPIRVTKAQIQDAIQKVLDDAHEAALAEDAWRERKLKILEQTHTDRGISGKLVKDGRPVGQIITRLSGPDDYKQCSKCGHFKNKQEFYVRSSAKDGRKSACKECDDQQGRIGKATKLPYISHPNVTGFWQRLRLVVGW